jgi:hypothetical protein
MSRRAGDGEVDQGFLSAHHARFRQSERWLNGS